MSDTSITIPSADLKALLSHLPAHLRVDIHHVRPKGLGSDNEHHVEISPMSESQREPRRPRRRPPQSRRPRPRTSTLTPYQAKRAAMEDMEIRRLRRDGFTPYFGDEKRFLMTPPEFDLVLACEPRQVIQVIHEVLKQSVGYSGDGEHGRREWVALPLRHFERRGLMGRHAAQDALDHAVEQGYLLRRPRGKRRWTMWEYAVHYRQVDNVPR